MNDKSMPDVVGVFKRGSRIECFEPQYCLSCDELYTRTQAIVELLEGMKTNKKEIVIGKPGLPYYVENTNYSRALDDVIKAIKDMK